MGLYFTIGESTKGRLPAARDRLKEQFFIPLAELRAARQERISAPEDIAKRYSQSCGLAAFLIDGNHGRYREPLSATCKPFTPATTTTNHSPRPPAKALKN